jgi:excisionase family DNA binding protein
MPKRTGGRFSRYDRELPQSLHFQIGDSLAHRGEGSTSIVIRVAASHLSFASASCSCLPFVPVCPVLCLAHLAQQAVPSKKANSCGEPCARKGARIDAAPSVSPKSTAAFRQVLGRPPGPKAPSGAKILEFTEQYVYELIRRGQLPAVRSGKYVRVSSSAVDSFIRNDSRNRIDSSVYHRYSPVGGRPNATPTQDARRLDTGGARRQARRRAE